MKKTTRAYMVECSIRTEGLSGMRPIARDILASDAAQRATIRDLRARLEAVAGNACSCVQPMEAQCESCRWADLKNKNWREP